MLGLVCEFVQLSRHLLLPLHHGRHAARLPHAPSPQAAALDMPALRQDIAWELVLRDLREAEVGLEWGRGVL